jgi:hypothetical protein
VRDVARLAAGCFTSPAVLRSRLVGLEEGGLERKISSRVATRDERRREEIESRAEEEAASWAAHPGEQ